MHVEPADVLAQRQLAIDPPASASKAAGRVNGSTQQAVQAAAASAALTEAVAAILLSICCLGAQPQPRESSDGRLQDGPITLM